MEQTKKGNINQSKKFGMESIGIRKWVCTGGMMGFLTMFGMTPCLLEGEKVLVMRRLRRRITNTPIFLVKRPSFRAQREISSINPSLGKEESLL